MFNYYNETSLELPYFEATNPPTFIKKDKLQIEVVNGRITKDVDRTCPDCHGKLHIHDKQRIKLKHFAGYHKLIKVNVTFNRYICTCCKKIVKQDIPFKHPKHLITNLYANQILNVIADGDTTCKAAGRLLHCDETTIRELDKKRLQRKYGEMKPTGTFRYIGVDEFSIEKNHKYATIVVDLDTGHVLYLEKGKTAEQFHHFFDLLSAKQTLGIKAVAMDMNATYPNAVAARCPDADICYDLFHIVKYYNDNVITSLRRSEQAKIIEAMNNATDPITKKMYEKEASYFKNSRFIIISNRSTLEAKDRAARRHNNMLREKYTSKGLKIPANERKLPVDNVDRLKTLVIHNENIGTAVALLEQLKFILKLKDEATMSTMLKEFIEIAKETKIPQIVEFGKTMERRFDGIISLARHRISNARVEGINNLVKTIKRRAYGYRDLEYFFLKIWEASRRYSYVKYHKKIC